MNIEDRRDLAEVLDKRMKFQEREDAGSVMLHFHSDRKTAEWFKAVAGCGSVTKAGGSYRWSLYDRKKIAWLLGLTEEFMQTPVGKRRSREVQARMDLLERRRKVLMSGKRSSRFEPNPKKRPTLTPAWDSSAVARAKAASEKVRAELEANRQEV